MAVEPKRGCGYRKVGGIYLMSDGVGAHCHRLPIPLHVCPTCSAGVKHSLGFTWITPLALFGKCESTADHECGSTCFVCNPPEGKHGLIWIGKQFYKTPDMFVEESRKQGISRRIPAVPRDFKLGETIVYIAHIEACEVDDLDQPDFPHAGDPEGFKRYKKKKAPGIFQAFKPQRIEKIITETESKDLDEMEALKKRDITPVIVPDDDKDHQGSVHDKKEKEE